MFQPPWPREEIHADLLAVEAETLSMLAEVRG